MDVRPRCLPEWYGWIEFNSASLSMIANLSLIYLVIFHTPPELKVFRRVLFCNCFVDIVYTISAYIIELHMYFLNGVVFYTVKDVFVSDLHGRFLQTSFFWFATYLTIFIISVPFVYRYFAVCHNWIMTNVAFAALVLFEVVVAFLAALTLYVLWWPSIEHTAAMVPETAINCSDTGRVPHYTMEEAMSPRIGGVLVMYMVLVSLHYVVVIFCSYKIFKTIKESTGMSRKTTSINSQLNNVLCLQALTPLFVAVVPICGCIIMLLFGLSWLGRLLELTTSVLSWIPIMNPLFTVIFVKAYRRAVCGALYRGLVKAAGPMSTTSGVSPLQGPTARQQ